MVLKMRKKSWRNTKNTIRILCLMSYEELYNKAMNGDADALSRLIEDAEMGEATAQYWLSCQYEAEGPLKDEEQSDYWLDMAVYNGNPMAVEKRKRTPHRHNERTAGENKTSSVNMSEDNEAKNEEQEGKAKRKSKNYIWIWGIFLVLIVAKYISKCEEQRERDEGFDRFMEWVDHKEEIFNPSEHIETDSNLNIKADKEYIEWLEKKTRQTN